MPRTCKNNPRRTEHTRRRFQQRPTASPMPHLIVHRSWLPDGNQVAVAQVNDLFVVQRFDASERPVGSVQTFSGKTARTQALGLANCYKTRC